MTQSFFDEASYYRKKDRESPESRFWGSRKGQHARFDAIMRQASFKGNRILDVGCGSGDLLAYAVDRGAAPSQYLGVDVVPEFIAEARTRGLPGEFIATDVTAANWKPPVTDWVVANGLFGHRQPGNGWWQRYRLVTQRMYGWASMGIVYTLISCRSGGSNPEAQYCEPSEILTDAATRLGPWVLIDHTYLQNDFLVAALVARR